jgi:chemotaxis signal transduction protein
MGICTTQQQRIVQYEEKAPETLNSDQKTAIASKPALEAVVKELQELLVILKVRRLLPAMLYHLSLL